LVWKIKREREGYNPLSKRLLESHEKTRKVCKSLPVFSSYKIYYLLKGKL